MKWKLLNGNERNFNAARYKIDFAKKSSSNPEQIFKNWIKINCFSDFWMEQFRIPTTLLRVDFVNLTKKIAFEIQGSGNVDKKSHHEEFNVFFHKNRIGYLQSIRRDAMKYNLLTHNGFELIELYDTDLQVLSREYLRKKFNVLF